jgi:hypothetical protein
MFPQSPTDSYTYNYLRANPASRSSRAPVGLFSSMARPAPKAPVVDRATPQTALADGGKLSAPFSPITRWRKAGGTF